MQVTRYPMSQTTTPLDLMAAMITDPTGNNGARISNPPTGPDGNPIPIVALVPINAAGDFIDLTPALSATSYGITAAGTAAANTTAFNAMTDLLGNGPRPVLIRVPSGTYNMNQIAISKSNLIFDMRGVTFIGPQCEFVTSPSAMRVGIIGPCSLIRTDAVGVAGDPGNDTGPVLHLNGLENFAYPQVRLEKSPEGGGYMAMFEYDATNGHVKADLILRGGNGIFLEGVGHRINVDAIGRNPGADDCFAFKARGIATRECVVTGVVDGYATAVAFGSEIGTLGVTDATRAGRAQNNYIDLVTRNCTFPFFFKPGAIDNGAAYDWRSGLVEGNKLRIQATDLTGAKMQRAIYSASRGALVCCNEVDIIFQGRVDLTGGLRKALVDFYIPDYSASVPPAAAPTIRDNKTRITHDDPFDGAVNGAGVPGNPVPAIVIMDKQSAGHGTFSNNAVEIETANGTSTDCIYVGASCDNGLFVRRIGNARNINVSGGTINGGGIRTLSRVSVGSEININVVTGTPYRIVAPGDVLCPELSEEVFLFQQINLGNADTQYPWTAKRRCQVVELDYTGTLAVAASDVDYTTLSFKNRGAASTTFLSPRTKATGALSTARNFTIVLGTSAVLYKLSDLDPNTDAANIVQTLFAENAVMQMDKADTGAGRTLQNGRLRIRALPY